MKNHCVVAVLCLIAASCEVNIGPPSGSAGGNGAGGNGAGGNGPDPTLPEGDAFPKGAISFFYRLTCPFDWSVYPEAAGRIIIAASAGLPSGTTIGEPLSSGEDRVHTHDLSASVTITALQYFAPEGGPNGTMTQPMPYSFSWTSDPTPAGVPYRQLLVCKKVGEPKAATSPLPPKLHTYFELDACPSGWKPATGTIGRILVGLPMGGAADMSMGGEPILTSAQRTHTHAFSSTLTTTPWGVLAPLGIGAFFGQDGSYPFSGESEPAEIGVPMISLLHCEKQ